MRCIWSFGFDTYHIYRFDAYFVNALAVSSALAISRSQLLAFMLIVELQRLLNSLSKVDRV